MHGCSWKEGRGVLLKSSTLGKGERRGWVDGGMECALLRETPPLIATNTAKPSTPPSLSFWFTRLIPYGPRLTLHHDWLPLPHATTWPMLGEAVCLCIREGEGGSVCGLCHGVCHLLSHNTLGTVCAQKRAGSWGTHPVRMLCYYLSSGWYESQGTVSGKRGRLPREQRKRGKTDGWRRWVE